MIIKGNMKIGDVRLLDIGNTCGVMNTAHGFYPREMTIERRRANFLKRRRKLAEGKGFDGKKMFMADQTNKDGSYCVLTEELINSKEDGWLNDIPEDILIITKETPGVVIGHPVADCPVIIMTDKSRGVTAVGHCSGEMVDKKLPISIFRALEKEFGSTMDDVKVYVSSCISNKWEYNCWPDFAKNKELWEGCIVPGRTENGKTYYRIDIRKAISNQLVEIGIDGKNVYWNMDDTLTNPNYYSHVGSKINAKKKGRNFVGAYYYDKNLVK